MTGLGVGPEVVEEMDMRRLNDLMGYWIDHPPAHIAAAQVRDVIITALGGKPPSKSAPPKEGIRVGGVSQTPEEFAAFLGIKLEAT